MFLSFYTTKLISVRVTKGLPYDVLAGKPREPSSGRVEFARCFALDNICRFSLAKAISDGIQ